MDQNKVCHLCDHPIIELTGPLGLTKDHVIPKSKGGKNTKDNLLPAHRICNHIKDDRDLTDELREECRKAFEKRQFKPAKLKKPKGMSRQSKKKAHSIPERQSAEFHAQFIIYT